MSPGRLPSERFLLRLTKMKRYFLNYCPKGRLLFIIVSAIFFFSWMIVEETRAQLNLQSLIVNSVDVQSYRYEEEISNQMNPIDEPVKYAIFSASTPTNESDHTYDYAYNLPLTTLAWERIGFKSIILIVGFRSEWETDPVLNLVLSYLEERRAILLFIETPVQYRTAVGKAGPIFGVNLKGFPGKDGDFLMTTDADLWPLQEKYFVARPNYDIVLINNQVSEQFELNKKTYVIQPMSNIGANVSTWKQIVNDGHSIASNSETIMNDLENVFGESARSKVIMNQTTWFMDQKLVSIRLAEWMDKHRNNTVFRETGQRSRQLDRTDWDARKLSPENLQHINAAHLLRKSYLPIRWLRINPLVSHMYGQNTWQATWIDKYNQQFLVRYKKSRNFNDHQLAGDIMNL